MSGKVLEKIQRAAFAFGKVVFAAAVWLGATGVGAAQLSMDWTERFDLAFRDQALALAVDAAGAVYVTGSAGPSEIDADVLTIKYDAAGNQAWVATFDGPSGGVDGGRDVLLNPGGDVLVLAQSECEFWVLRYDAADGSLVDTLSHDSGFCPENPVAFACDAFGDLYVAGQSWGNQNDIYTFKMEPDGNVVWTARYDGPGPFLFAHDVPASIALDSHGDVFVAGSSNASSASEDFVTIKYSGTDGTQIWLQRYTGAGANDIAAELALDAADNVYVAGSSYQLGWLFVTVKYRNSDGQQLWVGTDDPGTKDTASALAFDSAGDVYVVGRSDPDGDDDNLNENAVVAKHRAADGAPLWMTIYGEDEFNDFDSAIDVVVDSNDRLFTSGQSGSFGASYDVLVLELDPASGLILQEVVFDDGDSELSSGIELALDGDQDLLVTGTARDGNNEARDVLAIKVSTECDFTLEVTPQNVTEGEALSFAATGGLPLGTVLLAATAVDGSPLFLKVLVSGFDAGGEWSFAPAVPPGLAGLEVTFQTFGIDCTGSVAASNAEPINFE